jgi:flagellar hook-length control protein FliK
METPVARTLLKIDSEELTALENTTAAAGTDKMDLPKPLSLVLGRSLGQEMTQQLSPQQQPQSPLPTEGVGRTGAEAPLLHANPSRMLERLEESVMGQLSTRLTAALKAGAAAHEVKIMLRPEALGQVQLRVQMEGEKVITQIRVENQQVKQIIENNLQSLKSALAEHNLQSGSFSVDVDAGSWQHGRQQPTTGDFAASGGSAGASAEEDVERDVAGAAPQPIRGQDTGRRYGDNSLEYYA